MASPSPRTPRTTAPPTPVATPPPTPVVTPTPTPSGQPAQGQAILLLNTWKNGALDVGASVHVLAGDIVVDSASCSAAKTSGEGSVAVDSPYLTKVVGLTTGSGFSPPAQTGASPVDDPLAGYPQPNPAALP